MKTTVNFCDFTDAFRAYDRQDNFSYAGLQALFEWLEDYEEDTGEEVELDVISLCCDFSEHESAFACLSDYMTEDQFVDQFVEQMAEGDEELEEACLDYLHDSTFAIPFDGGIIIQAF